IAGAAIQWLRDGLGVLKKAAESEKLARSVDSTLGTYLVPAFVGLGAPYWDAEARGAILGITRGTTRADVVRAALDSIAYQICDATAAMERDAGSELHELRADGGATANSYLMQFQADLLGKPVRRSKIAETTAYGAALLAGLATGVWSSQQELSDLMKGGDLFRPRIAAQERERLLEGWRDAVSRVLTRAAHE
ncbi:MAG TPA: FGGY-family carbohydrate kinase, partial [Candidatus Binataceae bacterium]|nr:FGGY-family carbohydrate kinase [Candidatus Binataceae bacterium]